MLQAAERHADEAQVGGGVVLVQRLREPRVVELVLTERGRDPERLGRGRLVLELAGVGDQAGVEAHRGLVGHVAADRLDQPEHDLAGRGCRGSISGSCRGRRSTDGDRSRSARRPDPRRVRAAPAGRTPRSRRSPSRPAPSGTSSRARDPRRRGASGPSGEGSSGSLGYEHTVRTPRDRRNAASPSIEPSASASGFTWHASDTSAASESTWAARARSSVTVRPRPGADPRSARRCGAPARRWCLPRTRARGGT